MEQVKKGKDRRKEGMKKEGERGMKEVRDKQMNAIEKEEITRLDEHHGISFRHSLLVIRLCCRSHMWHSYCSCPDFR